MLRSAELAGATLTISTSTGAVRLRIDAVERERETGDAQVWLHSFSTATEYGSRQPLCEPGPDGRPSVTRTPSGSTVREPRIWRLSKRY